MAYIQKLQQLNKMIRDEIQIIEKGGKLSTFKREEKARETDLKKQLLTVIKEIAKTGECDNDMWIQIRNYITVMIGSNLDNAQKKYNDSKTFDQEKEVILQYMVYFERPPFTLQRICEVLLDSDSYYKSCRKLLYAYEKLVNVGDPEDR